MSSGTAPFRAIAVFKGSILRVRSEAAVFLVHGGADPVTDEAADDRACNRRRNASSAPAELISDQRAGSRPDKRARILVIGASSRQNHKGKRCKDKS